MNIKTTCELENLYNEALDEHGEIKIGCLSFSPSRILKEIDPIAYDCGLYDFADSMGIDTDELDKGL